MYFLFRFKNWKPTDYYNMDFGEKCVVHAFMMKEMEERNRDFDEAE